LEVVPFESLKRFPISFP